MMALMKRIAAALVLLMFAACAQREVVSTDTAQSTTGVTNTDTSTTATTTAVTETSSTITPGTPGVAPTATETVAASQQVNVETKPGKASATKKTKH